MSETRSADSVSVASARRLLFPWAASIFALLAIYLTTATICAPDHCRPGVVTAVNFLGQSFLILSTAEYLRRLIKLSPSYVLTPLFGYPLSTGLFFGFGNMSVIMSNDATQTLLSWHHYGIDTFGLLQTNLLTMAGVLCTTLALMVGLKLRLGNGRSTKRRMAPSYVAVIFLLSGAALKYFIVLPADYGVTHWEVPGSLRRLTFLVDLGFAVAAYLSVSGQRNWTLILIAFWPPYFLLTLLQFSKEAVLLAILLPALGAYLCHGRVRILVLSFIVSVPVFIGLQNINTAARQAIFDETGDSSRASLQERISIIKDVWGSGPESQVVSSAQVGVQSWWLRLSYAGAQKRATELYDSGAGGQWYQSPLVFFIPRLLWPDKPAIVHPGLIFNRLSSGDRNSQSYVGMTVYAEGYWISGWPGVISFSLVMGLAFGMIGKISYRQVVSRNFVYLPSILIGLHTSLTQPTNYFQNGVLGSLSIYVFLSAAISLSLLIGRPRAKQRAL